MNHRFVTILILALFVFGSLPASAQLKKVRLSMPTVAITEIPFKIAQAKGFYREEGLDVEMIVIRGALGSDGAARRVGGLHYCIWIYYRRCSSWHWCQTFLLIDSKPGFDLVSDSQVRSFETTQRQSVGISSRGGSVDLLTRLTLERNGLNPDKDVTILVIGTQQETGDRSKNRKNFGSAPQSSEKPAALS